MLSFCNRESFLNVVARRLRKDGLGFLAFVKLKVKDLSWTSLLRHNARVWHLLSSNVVQSRVNEKLVRFFQRLRPKKRLLIC